MYGNEKGVPYAPKDLGADDIQKAITNNIPKPEIDVRPLNLGSPDKKNSAVNRDINAGRVTQGGRNIPQRPATQRPAPTSNTRTNNKEFTSRLQTTPQRYTGIRTTPIAQYRQTQLADDIRKQYDIGRDKTDQDIVQDYQKQYPSTQPYLQDQSKEQQIIDYTRRNGGFQEVSDEEILEDYYKKYPDQRPQQFEGAIKGAPSQNTNKWLKWLSGIKKINRLDPTFDWDKEKDLGAPDVPKMFGNLPASSANVAIDLTNMALDPIDTGKGLLQMALGGIYSAGKGVSKLFGDNESVDTQYDILEEKLKNSPGVAGRLGRTLSSSEDMAKMVGESLVERYGSSEAIAETMTEDPIGMISDIAAIVEGAALITRAGLKGAGSVGRSAGADTSRITRAADQAGDVAAAARQVDPYEQAFIQGGRGIQSAYQSGKNMVSKGVDTARSVRDRLRPTKIVDNTKTQVLSQVSGIPEDALKIALEDPSITKAASRGEFTVESVKESIEETLFNIQEQSGNAGRQYQELYKLDTTFDGRQIYNNAIEEMKKLGIARQDGKVKIDSTQYNYKNGERLQLQKMTDILEEIKDNRSLSVRELHTVRKNIDNATKWMDGVAKRKSKAGGNVRKTIDTKLKEIPERKKLDGHFARVQKSINILKDAFFTKQGKFKKSGYSQIGGNMLNDRYAKELAIAERYVPGITRRIKGLKFQKALDDAKNLKPGQYTKSIILGALGAGATGPLGRLFGALTLNPELAVKIVQKLSKKEKKVLTAVSEGKTLSDDAQKIYDEIQTKIKQETKSLPEPQPQRVTPEGVIENKIPVRPDETTKNTQRIVEQGNYRAKEPTRQTNTPSELQKVAEGKKKASKDLEKAKVAKKYKNAKGKEITDVSKFKEGMITPEGVITRTGIDQGKPFYQVEGDGRFDYRKSGSAKATDLDRINLGFKKSQKLDTPKTQKLDTTDEKMPWDVEKKKVSKDGKASDNLLEEAKQYDSAEDFVFAQTEARQFGGSLDSISKKVDVDTIKPSQTGEDLFNETSESYAKGGRADNIFTDEEIILPKLTDSDVLPPIVIDDSGKIIDGNSRWAASKTAGIKQIRVVTESQLRKTREEANNKPKDILTEEEKYRQHMEEMSRKEISKFDKDMMKEIETIEGMEQRIGKVGKNKVNKAYQEKQRRQRSEKKERIIEEIAQEKGMSQDEAYEMYDKYIDMASETRTRYKKKTDAELDGYTIPQDEAEKIARKYFTEDELPVNFVENITTPEGQQAYGKYYNRTVDLVKNPKKGVVEHEVAHAYFDMFTGPERKAAILQEIKKRKGINNKIDAEEFLADEFSRYVQNKSTVTGAIKEYMKNIRNGIKKVFGKESKVRQFFNDIEKRKGMKSKYDEPVPRKQATPPVKFRNDGKAYLTTRVIEDIKRDINKDTITKGYLNNIKNRQYNKLDKMAIDEAIEYMGDRKRMPRDEIIEVIRDSGYKLDVKESKKFATYNKLYRITTLKGNGNNPKNGAITKIYRSPKKISDDNHFSDPNYYGHTRIHDKVTSRFNGDTRRIIEIQSDLFQKNKLTEKDILLQIGINDKTQKIVRKDFGKEYWVNYEESQKLHNAIKDIAPEGTDTYVFDNGNMALYVKAKHPKAYKEMLSKIQKKQEFIDTQKKVYRKRMINEEIVDAINSGKKKLQVPDGRTIAEIEGHREKGIIGPDSQKGAQFDLMDETMYIDQTGLGALNLMEDSGIIRADRDTDLYYISDPAKMEEFVLDLIVTEKIKELYEEYPGTEKFWYPEDEAMNIGFEIQDGNSFKIDDLAPEHQTVANFYEKTLIPYIEKNYGGKFVEGDGGRRWEVDDLQARIKVPKYKKSTRKKGVPQMKSLFDNKNTQNRLASSKKKDTIKPSSNNQNIMKPRADDYYQYLKESNLPMKNDITRIANQATDTKKAFEEEFLNLGIIEDFEEWLIKERKKPINWSKLDKEPEYVDLLTYALDNYPENVNKKLKKKSWNSEVGQEVYKKEIENRNDIEDFIKYNEERIKKQAKRPESMLPMRDWMKGKTIKDLRKRFDNHPMEEVKLMGSYSDGTKEYYVLTEHGDSIIMTVTTDSRGKIIDFNEDVFLDDYGKVR